MSGLDKKKGNRAPLDPCLIQNVLCSLSECVTNFVREKNTLGERTTLVY